MSNNPLTQLTEEEEMFQDAVRNFSEEQIRPLTHKMDEEEKFNSDLLKKFFEMNLMGIQIPQQWGGAGGSFFMSILAVEELSRVDPSAGVIIDVQNTLVNNALLNWGSEEQKSHYLPQLSSNQVGAYALSEAGAGSDAFALQTTATPDGNAYLLNGQKLWTTNALEADIFIVFATLDRNLGHRGITAFLVEKSFSRILTWEKRK